MSIQPSNVNNGECSRMIGKCLATISTIALIVSALALLVLASHHMHELITVGGGLRPGIVQFFGQAAKWSGIIGGIGMLLTAVSCGAGILSQRAVKA